MKCIFHVSALHVDTLKSLLSEADVIFVCKTINCIEQVSYLIKVNYLLSGLVYKDCIRIIQDYLPESHYEGASCDVPLNIITRIEFKEE